MKYFALSMLLACASLCPFGLYGADTVTDKLTGQSFPSSISIENNGKTYELEATGVATRKKLIIKVYSIASYLQKNAAGGATVLDKILSDENAKQLTMRYVFNANVNQVQEAFESSFHRVFSDQEYAKQQATITKFLSFFNQPLNKGDECILRWFPGGVVEVLINGKKTGEITDAAFAKGLWQVWLGANSIVNRDDLVSLKS